MNPAHDVDIYIDAATFAAAVYRRHGSHWWHSDGAADAYLVGLAVSEALDPKRLHRLAWAPSFDNYVHVMETWQNCGCVAAGSRDRDCDSNLSLGQGTRYRLACIATIP